jgi:hypothetical protein
MATGACVLKVKLQKLALTEFAPPSERHFALLRVALGAYLAVHFAALVPYADELFSSTGMLSDASVLPSSGIFPNPLALTTPGFPISFLIALCAASLLFASGTLRRVSALFLWFGWACLFNRNPFTSNPSIPYVGWLLLACTLIPNEQRWRMRWSRLKAAKTAEPWHFPPFICLSAWLLLGLGYTLSGLHKLTSPSWLDGTALRHVLELPLARDTSLRNALLAMPNGAFAVATYGALALELLALPLLVWRATRGYTWFALVAMQLGILCVLDFADLTLGMLLFHALIFDPRWLKRSSLKAP